ncbi:NPAS4 protein, partial [Chordeiles acutipennis]|nr:NPAS4 protein [Chordeiles acutipennis]
LGYGRVELLGRSWYRLLHPEDLGHVARQHLRLGQCPPSVVPRVTWDLPVTLGCPQGFPPVTPSLSHSEAEAWCLRQQLAAESPPGHPETFSPGLDFPGANVGAGGDLGVGADPGVGLGVDLGVGSGLGDDVGVNVGVSVGLGLGVNIGCGLGA